jgi:hypothetical protein
MRFFLSQHQPFHHHRRHLHELATNIDIFKLFIDISNPSPLYTQQLFIVFKSTTSSNINAKMFSLFALFLALFALLFAPLATVMAETHGITPHDMYSSSQGVLGCKVDTNRIAYWPMAVDCDNICVKVSYAGRSLNLLRIDRSGGAYDISYDAWNYLYTGKSAHDAPATGGAVNMDVSFVPASECASLLKVGRLPLSASNSMNYLSNCLSQPNSWVA